MSGTYAVVLSDPMIEDTDTLQKIAKAIQTVTGMVPYDGVRLARNAQGVLMEKLSDQDAGALVGALAAAGVTAGLADAAALGDSQRAQRIREIGVAPGGLGVQTGYAGMDAIPWDRVSLVSVCLYWEPQQKIVLKKDTSRKTMFRGARMMLGGNWIRGMIHMRRAAKEARDSVQRLSASMDEGECYILDMYLSNPPSLLRMRSNQCAYTYLGDRRQPKTELNFQAVVADIAAMSDVPMSPQALRFLEGDKLAENRMDDLSQFDRYNRWLFLSAAAFAE